MAKILEVDPQKITPELTEEIVDRLYEKAISCSAMMPWIPLSRVF